MAKAYAHRLARLEANTGCGKGCTGCRLAALTAGQEPVCTGKPANLLTILRSIHVAKEPTRQA